jgi:hypothetical protein
MQSQHAEIPQQEIAPEQTQTLSHATSTPVDFASIASLNSSLEKLNVSFAKMLILFDKAEKDMANEKPDDTHLLIGHLESQNEKIAAGIVSMANMIRDQQIQMNQMVLLFKGMQERIEELRLQRRPVSSFKIPPKIAETEEMTPQKENTMTSSTRDMPTTIEIEVPKSPAKEILEEEKSESYPTLSSMLGPTTMSEPPDQHLDVQIASADEIPAPPSIEKKGLFKFLKK